MLLAAAAAKTLGEEFTPEKPVGPEGVRTFFIPADTVNVCIPEWACDTITSPHGYEGKHLDETEGISAVLAAGALIHVSGLGYNNVAALINSISAGVVFFLLFFTGAPSILVPLLPSTQGSVRLTLLMKRDEHMTLQRESNLWRTPLKSLFVNPS